MVLEGACIFLNKKQPLSTSSTSVNIYIYTYIWKVHIKPIAHDAYLSIFTLHLKLPTQTSNYIMQLGNPIPDLPSWITTLPWKKTKFCVFIQTYVHVTPSKRSRRNAEKVCSSRKKGNTHNFLWVSHEGSKACCLYIIQIYKWILYIYIIPVYIP